jgi:hypothetical protein
MELLLIVNFSLKMSSLQLNTPIFICDSTWCDCESSTKTNIYELVETIGISITDAKLKASIHFLRPDIRIPAAKAKSSLCPRCWTRKYLPRLHL